MQRLGLPCLVKQIIFKYLFGPKVKINLMQMIFVLSPTYNPTTATDQYANFYKNSLTKDSNLTLIYFNSAVSSGSEDQTGLSPEDWKGQVAV